MGRPRPDNPCVEQKPLIRVERLRHIHVVPQTLGAGNRTMLLSAIMLGRTLIQECSTGPRFAARAFLCAHKVFRHGTLSVGLRVVHGVLRPGQGTGVSGIPSVSKGELGHECPPGLLAVESPEKPRRIFAVSRAESAQQDHSGQIELHVVHGDGLWSPALSGRWQSDLVGVRPCGSPIPDSRSAMRAFLRNLGRSPRVLALPANTMPDFYGDGFNSDTHGQHLRTRILVFFHLYADSNAGGEPPWSSRRSARVPAGSS
jgi:hypothetical protein